MGRRSLYDRVVYGRFSGCIYYVLVDFVGDIFGFLGSGMNLDGYRGFWE